MIFGQHVYSATFNGVAVSAAQDLFEIVAPAAARVHIREIAIGQYSDAGDAQDELLGILLMRGHTTSGSGGASVTPGVFDAYLRAAGTAAERNNTTVATAGSPVVLYADTFNVRAGWYWRSLDPDIVIVLQPSDRFVVRITAPSDEITMNGTIMFSEQVKAPVS